MIPNNVTLVCWEHDWHQCPLEVIELKSEIQSLDNYPITRPGSSDNQVQDKEAIKAGEPTGYFSGGEPAGTADNHQEEDLEQEVVTGKLKERNRDSSTLQSD